MEIHWKTQTTAVSQQLEDLSSQEHSSITWSEDDVTSSSGSSDADLKEEQEGSLVHPAEGSGNRTAQRRRGKDACRAKVV